MAPVVLSALFLVLGTPQPALAALLNCPSGDVACLIAAIHTANATAEDDIITLTGGAYVVRTVDNNADGPNGLPSITSAITLRGAPSGDTILQRPSRAPRFRLLHVAVTGQLTVESLTLRGGAVAFGSGGAGLFNRGSTTLRRSALVGNVGQFVDGGGLFNAQGTVLITHSTVSGNRVGSNFVEQGGGLFNAQGHVTISHSTIAANFAHLRGGGLANTGTLKITHSTIADNTTSFSEGAGGGILHTAGTATLTNCTIAGNAASFGGGISNTGGTVRSTNCTISDNVATFAAGGLESLGGAMRLENTILARNFPDDCQSLVSPEGVTSLGHNLVGDPTSCPITLQPSDLTGDPELGGFTDTGGPGQGFLPVLAGSPVIDAGNDQACLRTDQLDQMRADGDGNGVVTCDIGAIEFQP